MRAVSHICVVFVLCSYVALVSVAIAGEASGVDAAIRSYAKVSGVSGTINSIGSDTLNNLMTLWAEGFRRQYPNVRIQVEGKGSSTAPASLIEGTAQFGPMSRLMKATHAALSQLGIELPVLICMATAAVFAVISMFVGIRMDPKTIGEWQVIQYWRIEWLLGAIVMLLFGVLLRKSH